MEEKHYTYKDIAKEMVLAYFNDNNYRDKLNANGLAEYYAIQNDDAVLLEHINAYISIFTKAKEQIETENFIEKEQKNKEDGKNGL